MQSSQRSHVAPFLAMESLSEANQFALQTGANVIHMSLGQPGAALPQRALDVVADMVRRHHQLGYTEAAGLRSLRKRIAEHYAESYGVDVPMERVFVTMGSSSGLLLSLTMLFDAGQRVAMVAPCYAAYISMLTGLGIEPVLLRGTDENNYQPTVALLEQAGKIDGLMITSPSNPTGTVIDPAQLAEVLDYCQKRGIKVISDEIYHHVSYDGAVTASALESTHDVVVINSFSKYFLMPGWRLGWVIVPEEMTRTMESLAQGFFVSPAAIAQYAALEAFHCRTELDEVVKSYSTNRNLVLDGLRNVGINRYCPAQGAFFVFADITSHAANAREFCHNMLHHAHIAAVPGDDFDPELGSRYVRFSYCGTTEAMTEAMQRLENWLGKK